MIRKRLLSACLALALCLGLLPVTALAAAPERQKGRLVSFMLAITRLQTVIRQPT